MTVCHQNVNTHHSRDYRGHEDMHVLRRIKSYVIMWPTALQIYCKANIYERTNVMQLGSMFISNCNIALHVSDAFCVHLQEHL